MYTLKLGEGKVVSDEKEKPVYGKNLLEEPKKESAPASKGGGSKGKLLTKSDILMGKEKRMTVHLDHYDKDVLIRPLTDGELSQVFEVIGNVPLNEQGLPDLNKVDLDELTRTSDDHRHGYGGAGYDRG